MYVKVHTSESALSKTQWSGLVTGRYMITMMVLLCFVNLSGMSLECIVIVLMNILLLDGQFCTDYVNIQQSGDNVIDHGQAIIPRLNFTCNGRITGIRARLWIYSWEWERDYPVFQVWRQIGGSTMYNKIGKVQLQSNDEVTKGSNDYWEQNIILTGNNIIEVQSGDVVGYYHPFDAHYRVPSIQTDGYTLYQFNGSHESVDLNNGYNYMDHQPLLQFTIGK